MLCLLEVLLGKSSLERGEGRGDLWLKGGEGGGICDYNDWDEGKGRLGEICDYNDWYEGRGGWGDL